MPVYKYECPNGHVNRIRRSVDDRDEPAGCLDCDKTARRDLLSELRTKAGDEFENFTPYFNENFATDEHPEGQFVKSRAENKRIKRQLNLRERGSFVE